MRLSSLIIGYTAICSIIHLTYLLAEGTSEPLGLSARTHFITTIPSPFAFRKPLGDPFIDSNIYHLGGRDVVYAPPADPGAIVGIFENFGFFQAIWRGFAAS